VLRDLRGFKNLVGLGLYTKKDAVSIPNATPTVQDNWVFTGICFADLSLAWA